MDFFDTVTEIAKNQTLKTETGDNRIFGVAIGLVVKNYDEDMPGRVCIQLPERDDKKNELQWAKVAMPSSGKGWGHYFLPEKGDQVLVAFEHGLIDRPYIIGCIPKSSDNFIRGAADKNNQYKKIVTRYGSTILFEDTTDEEGSGDGTKDKISIFTHKKEHQIVIDNENDSILISDEKKDNSIQILTGEQGEIRVKCQKKMTINVGDTIKVILNGENGKVTLECDDLNVKTSKNTSISADSRISIKGGNVVVEGSSQAKLTSGGALNMSGSPIKM